MKQDLNILLNGQPHGLQAPCSAAELIEQLGLGGQRLALEINGDIIPRSQHDSTLLKEGDKVEIVRAIGGG